MTKVALIGASGKVGVRLVNELSNRGHSVTGIARHPENIPGLANVTAVRGDVSDKQGLVELLKGHDAVISSVHFLDSDYRLLVDAVRASGVKRYLVVGGAGSLEIAPGKRLVDQPEFPEIYKAEALKGGEFLTYLKQVDDLDWTFLSPSALFMPGERTGTFRLGEDQLLSSDKGSTISFEDYAIAMVDEIENPKNIRKRFTVGY